MDGRRARGAETRMTTLRRAAAIASVDGLDGLTIGRLAGDLQISKSGVFANFGSKEELQLATIEHAIEVMRDAVVTPAMSEEPGLPRLRTMLANWLEYSRARVFPGGCFFAAVTAEFDARDGRVHDVLVRTRKGWMTQLVAMVRDAVDRGELPADTDADQLAFELDALARAANGDAVLTGSTEVYRKALRGIEDRLGVNRESG